MPWQGWWLVALDGLAGGRGDEGGEAVVAAFRDHLGDAQGQAYRATAQQNASSITRRFTLVPGFKAVLTEELRAMQVPPPPPAHAVLHLRWKHCRRAT